jgi:hypothetical protein
MPPPIHPEVNRANTMRLLSILVAALLWFPFGLFCGVAGVRLSNRARVAAAAGDAPTAKRLLDRTRTLLLVALAGVAVYAAVLMWAVFTNRI